MRVAADVGLALGEPARPDRRVADALALRVDARDAEHRRMAVGAVDRVRRDALAARVRALRAAVARREDDVGAERLERGRPRG